MEDIVCAVCFNEFHERDFVPKLLDCSHTFCASCVQELLKSTRECPFCKKKMERTEYPTNLMGLKLMDFCNKSSNDPRFSSLSIQKCLGECEEKKVDVKREMKRLSGELENLKERRNKLVEERKQLDENIDGLNERIEKNQTSSQALESGLVKLEQLEEKWKPVDEKRIGEAMEVLLPLKDLFPSVDQELLKLEDFENETAFKTKVAHRAKGGESVLCVKDVKEERRYGKLTLLDGCLLGHSLSRLRGDAIKGATLVRFEDIAPSRYEGVNSFLLLQSGPDGPQIRINIRLQHPQRWTPQFAHLCTGELGPSYKGAQVRDGRGGYCGWGSVFFGVDEYMEDGREGSGKIETLFGGDRGRDFEDQVVIKGSDDGSFKMVKVKGNKSLWYVVGVVTSPPLSALASFPWGEEVRVRECGICVPISRSGMDM